MDTLDLSFPENANNKFDKSIQLLQNITFEKIQITGRLTREVGLIAESFIYRLIIIETYLDTYNACWNELNRIAKLYM